MKSLLRIIKKICHTLHLSRYSIKLMIMWPSRFLPLQRKVVFCHFFGKNYADEPKFIFLALHKKDPSIKCIWIAQNSEWPMPEGMKAVKYMSFAAIYHWYTAQIWVDSCKTTYRTPKRKGQFFLECWHGTLPLKQIEADVEKYLSKDYLSKAKSDSQIIDLMYSNNDFMFNLFKNRFWYNGTVLKCEEPRISILKRGKSIRPKVENVFPQIKEKKIIVYAPTFRNDAESDVYFWNYSTAIKACEKKFGGSFAFFIKLHPNVIDNPHYKKNPEGVINASCYSDLQELMAVADVVITDYSSAMFEFGTTGKPVFLYCPDLEEYTSTDRPFYFNLKQLPFRISKAESTLANDILQFDDNDYYKKIQAFYNSIGFNDSGYGDEFIADILLSKLNGSNRVH